MSEIYRIGHLEVDSPWGNAGGVVKRLEDAELMAHAGVGWIEVGSYTLEPRIGNSPNGEVVYHHNSRTGETFNSLGMPNKGFDIVEKEIPEMAEIANKHGKPLIVNVAPVSEDPVAETQELVDRAYESGAHAVLLNAGCPNVVTEDGGRHEILSNSPADLKLVLDGLEAVVIKYGKKIFIRTSPTPLRRIRDIANVILSSGVVGAVFTPNTWPGHKPLDPEGDPILEVPGNVGGKSGPATAGDASGQTVWTKYCLRRSDIDIVRSGGIMDGIELAISLHSNGAAAGAGTTFFYESAEEGWSEATDRLLREFEEAATN